MKTCPHCRRVNDDEAKNCLECGSELGISEKSATLQDQDIPKSDDESFSPWVKWVLYFAAWGVVVLATVTKENANFLAIFAFPLGLLGILPAETAVMAAWMLGLAAVIGGWIFYIILTVAIGRAKQASVFWLLYVVFCVLLALNVAGCKKLLGTAAGIH